MAGTRLGTQGGIGGGEEMLLLMPYTSVRGDCSLARAGVMTVLSFRRGTSVSGSGVMGQSSTPGLSLGV